ncbi:DUF2207 domain-containing protein [Nostoc sp. FACHB-87]|uniref:DUF2207 domain-containing protein n=1 Tax=Nostocaceae TaxID=1162 RepID=UPI001689778B|nr:MULTISPECIES: DUF2207 domain-containing protein [Nostocaceae]MBD2453132.1 DUF2207 domain-containing protein [Nostoc sp. FACHB-87]MBD2475089.1 DUF2207 domain-containing protein [Anabaena sp. FACHB-83]
MSKKLVARLLLFCFTFVLGFTFTIHNVQAESAPFYWEFINVDIAVQPNGDMLVTETQKYNFTGEYNHLRSRYIPLDKVDRITEVSVSENGQVLPSTTSTVNNQFWIRWEHQLQPPESPTFVLKYRVIGGLRVNHNYAQVDWEAIFSDRKVPIKQAQVRVEFPEELTTKIKAFQSFGVVANIRRVDTKTIEAVTKQFLEPGKGLEIQVIFDRAGTKIETSGWQSSQFFYERLLWILSGLLVVGMPLFLIIVSRTGTSSSYIGDSSSYYYGGGGDYGGGDCGGGGGGGGD